MVPRSSASAPLPPLWGARGVRIYYSARMRIPQPNPHPLPRYAAPSRSRRGLEMYLGYLCRLQPFPRPFPRPRAWSVAPRALAQGATVQTARPAPSRSRKGH